MSAPRAEGNVIHADFGNRASREEAPPLFEMSVSCRLLYCDEHVSVCRLTTTVNGQSLVQHVVTEAP
jgi:hypothetical protein